MVIGLGMAGGYEWLLLAALLGVPAVFLILLIQAAPQEVGWRSRDTLSKVWLHPARAHGTAMP